MIFPSSLFSPMLAGDLWVCKRKGGLRQGRSNMSIQRCSVSQSDFYYCKIPSTQSHYIVLSNMSIHCCSDFQRYLERATQFTTYSHNAPNNRRRYYHTLQCNIQYSWLLSFPVGLLSCASCAGWARLYCILP